MLRSLLAAALLVAALAVPANAAKPLRGITATVTADATEFRAGDTVTFTATTNAAWWKHDLRCYQDGVLVMVGGWHFFPAGTASVTLTLSSVSYNQNPIGAECEVFVAVWMGYDKGYNGTVRIPETLSFTLLP